jgi:hypothetical protein
MNAHRAKIVTETRFEESARRRIQGMSRRLQAAIHQSTRTGRKIPGIVFRQSLPLQSLLFRFAFLAFTRSPWRSATSAFALYLSASLRLKLTLHRRRTRQLRFKNHLMPPR